ELDEYKDIEGYEKIYDILKEYSFKGYLFEDDPDVIKIDEDNENKYKEIQPVKLNIEEIMKQHPT
ncbi:MAG: hypothetical protein MJ252_31005, partial [archaeon]|nr:hypothetical protein [archaeon]